MKAILGNGGRSIIAASVSARPDNFNVRQRHLAQVYADMARESGRLIVAYQPTPHGSLDREMLATFRQARYAVPVGCGHRDAHAEVHRAEGRPLAYAPGDDQSVDMTSRLTGLDFLSARAALLEAGVPVMEAAEARSEQEAVEHFRRFGGPLPSRPRRPASSQKRYGLRPPECRTRGRRHCGIQARHAAGGEGRLSRCHGHRSTDGEGRLRGVCRRHNCDPTFGPADNLRHRRHLHRDHEGCCDGNRATVA